jgi:hypothetical protein
LWTRRLQTDHITIGSAGNENGQPKMSNDSDEIEQTGLVRYDRMCTAIAEAGRILVVKLEYIAKSVTYKFVLQNDA